MSSRSTIDHESLRETADPRTDVLHASNGPCNLAGMTTAEHDPTTGVYATTPDYVHALELRAPERLLFVSGTMGLDPSGAAGETIEAQVALVWDNLRAILASAGMTLDNVVRVTSYLRDAVYVDTNAQARVAALGGRRVPTTAIVVGTLESDWLVEIEIVAAA
jgi:2-iminobutanoate/2-iminopropanoate deaminase